MLYIRWQYQDFSIFFQLLCQTVLFVFPAMLHRDVTDRSIIPHGPSDHKIVRYESSVGEGVLKKNLLCCGATEQNA